MKKVKENISITIIVILVLLSSILVGTPLYESNIQPVYIASGLFSILYYILKREKILQDKIDICVCLLAFSTLIPLIFNTCASVQGTIYSIMKYFCILNIFLITKHECKKNPRYKHIILNTIIISILVLCIFGLDEINGNYLKGLKREIGYKITSEKELRIGSLFSYANAMAITAVAGIFICIGYVFYNKNIKIKLIYLAISIVMLITMILTYSRLVLLIFGLMSIIYFLILFIKYNLKEKINRKVILASILILVGIIIYIIIGLQIPSKLILKEKYQKRLFNIEGETEYKIEFDIEAKSNIEENFIMKIVERNGHLDEVNSIEMKFDNYKGKKEIDLKTHKDTTSIYIYINREKSDGTFIINNMIINGEEEVINYKILPTNLVFKIQEISLKQKSAWERIVFIKDAFKEIKESWVLGQGGNAWRTVQLEVQQYNYYSKEVHSFPTQIFLENGIIGFIACLGIGIYVIKTIYKEIKNPETDIIKISSILAVTTVLAHNIFDFSMSFFYVVLIVFLIIVTLETEEKEQNKKTNIYQKIIKTVIIMVTIGSIYVSSIEMHYENNSNIIVLDYGETEVEFYEKYQILIPFNYEINMKKYAALVKEKTNNNEKIEETLKKIIKFEKYKTSNINLNNIYLYVKAILETKNNVNNKLDYCLEYINETQEFGKYKPEIQIVRLNRLRDIVTLLENKNEKQYAQKFEEQLNKEIIEKEKYILDYENCRYPEEKVKEYKEFIQKFEY